MLDQEWNIICESEFRQRLFKKLSQIDTKKIGWVTGPGRSGAVTAVYASHFLRVPFVPFGSSASLDLGLPLIVDTARQSGKTLRKASRKYNGAMTLAIYEEPPRVYFWYERKKPQSYKHEARK